MSRWRAGERFPPGESAADFHEPVATPENPGRCEYCGGRLEWNEGHGREYSIDCPACHGPCVVCGAAVRHETAGDVCQQCLDEQDAARLEDDLAALSEFEEPAT